MGVVAATDATAAAATVAAGGLFGGSVTDELLIYISDHNTKPSGLGCGLIRW